ncbi:hypothetical protein [Nonomuraea sp. NPDC050202]|uniref:hypothetical protein n=1 Tax=Nonomuraea sp. NPDC050202 TaxID=3155035 RepID=UPI0034010DA5
MATSGTAPRAAPHRPHRSLALAGAVAVLDAERRLIGATLMLSGIALLGVVTASVAAWFVGRFQQTSAAEIRNEAGLRLVLAELRKVPARLDERAEQRRDDGPGAMAGSR